MNTRNVILFDGVCNLCCGWVKFLIRLDKNALFKFASLQSETGKNLAIKFCTDFPETDSVIYIKNNNSFTESTAILEILKDLGGIWKISLIFKLIPKSIRDNIYKFIARKRYSVFGKKSSCMIPTPELQKRFLA